MNNPNNNPNELSPEASFNAIHSTLSQSQSALYLAGTATILLLWGALAASVTSPNSPSLTSQPTS